jgi:hypothetical protein
LARHTRRALRFTPGVRKFRSIEEMSRAREAAELEPSGG